MRPGAIRLLEPQRRAPGPAFSMPSWTSLWTGAAAALHATINVANPCGLAGDSCEDRAADWRTRSSVLERCRKRCRIGTYAEWSVWVFADIQIDRLILPEHSDSWNIQAPRTRNLVVREFALWTKSGSYLSTVGYPHVNLSMTACRIRLSHIC